MGRIIMKGHEVLIYRNRLDSLVTGGDDNRYIDWFHKISSPFKRTEYHYKKSAAPNAEDEVLVMEGQVGGGEVLQAYFKALQTLTDLEQVIHRQRQMIGAERLWNETVEWMREDVFESLKRCYLDMCKKSGQIVKQTGCDSNQLGKKYYYPIKKQFSPQIDWKALILFTGKLRAKCLAWEADKCEVWSEMTAEVSEDMAGAMELLAEVDYGKRCGIGERFMEDGEVRDLSAAVLKEAWRMI